MKYKKWLWQSTIAALIGVALGNSATAQLPPNLSDTTGFNSSNAPFVGISGSGGPTFFGGGVGNYNPLTGNIDFFWLSDGLSIEPGITLSAAEGDGSAFGSTRCTGDLCQESATETQEITLDEIAELLELDLERSLERLALAEDAVEKAASEPRRIVRRSTERECVNPYIRARDEVDRKVEQAQEFIEQVEPINPENRLW